MSGLEDEEAGLERLLAHPLAAAESDAILTGRGRSRPAAFGAFPRLIGHFPRDRGLFSVEKPCARPRPCLLDADVNAVGAACSARATSPDIVVFDQTTIADMTAYPRHQSCSGGRANTS